jgi:MFS family permease
VSQSKPAAPSESDVLYPGWPVVMAAFFGVMSGYSVLIPYTFGLFLKPIGVEFGWRRDQISVAFGCVAITVALCAPIMGRLFDRFGPRRTILPCIVLFSLTFSSLSLLTRSLVHFYVVFVILGLFGNGTTQLAYSRSVSTWFFKRRGTALSLVAAGAGVGAMLIPLLTAWLLQKYGWRTTYELLGLLILGISFPLTAFFVRDSDETLVSQATSPDKQSLLIPISSRPFWLLILAIFLYSISFNGVISHLAPLLTDRRFSLSTAAQSLSVLGGCGLIGRVVTGYLLDRFFAPRVSLVLFCSTVAGIFFLSSRSISSVLLSVALIGFAAGGESDITPYLLSRYFSLQSFATLYGFAWTAYATGTMIGPILMGRLYTLTGAYQSWGIQLLALPALISAFLMILMPRYPSPGIAHNAYPSAGSVPQPAMSDS